jgi:hypothetical protein
MKARTVKPEEMSIARPELGKHISKATDTYIYRLLSIIIIYSYKT